MNLELLNPFGRQIPDRVDATLPLAPQLHFQRPRPKRQYLAPSTTATAAAGDGTTSQQLSVVGTMVGDREQVPIVTVPDAVASTTGATTTTTMGQAATSNAANSAWSGSNSQSHRWNTINVNVLAEKGPSSYGNNNNSSSNNNNSTSANPSSKAAAAPLLVADEPPEWKAAYHVAFNRRGTYVAVGYGSGAVAVHDTHRRTVSALYRRTLQIHNPRGANSKGSKSSGLKGLTATKQSSSDSKSAKKGDDDSDDEADDDDDDDDDEDDEPAWGNGVTSVSWSRRSRILLAGAAGDAAVHVHDTTHPLGPDEAGLAMEPSLVDPPQQQQQTPTPLAAATSVATAAAGTTSAGTAEANSPTKTGDGSSEVNADSSSDVKMMDTEETTPGGAPTNTNDGNPPSLCHDKFEIIPPVHSFEQTSRTMFRDPPRHIFHVRETRKLIVETKKPGDKWVPMPVPAVDEDQINTATKRTASGGESAPTKTKKKKHPRIQYRHPILSFHFDQPVGGSLQVNPQCPTSGLAALADGSLVIYWFPHSSFTTFHPPAGTPHPDSSPKGSPGQNNSQQQQPAVLVVPVHTKVEDHFITCAAFDPRQHEAKKSHSSDANMGTPPQPRGGLVYAATRDGYLLAFSLEPFHKNIWGRKTKHDNPRSSSKSPTSAAKTSPSSAPPRVSKKSASGRKKGIAKSPTNAESAAPPPSVAIPNAPMKFQVRLGTTSSAWQLLVSRDGRYLVVNSADGALRLYKSAVIWKAAENANKKSPSTATATTSGAIPKSPKGGSNNNAATAGGGNSTTIAVKPAFVFQDVVSKIKFASCDLSADGEYLVGGANGDDNRYELYIWNTRTGNLLDKLRGPLGVQLYSCAVSTCLPARIAVATSDGLVDLWGPKLEWMAFCPDLDHALQRNIDYMEGEDELDEVVGENGEQSKSENEKKGTENDPRVDVMTIAPVPVFASDSEDETDIFSFETRVKNLFQARMSKAAAAAAKSEKSED